MAPASTMRQHEAEVARLEAELAAAKARLRDGGVIEGEKGGTESRGLGGRDSGEYSEERRRARNEPGSRDELTTRNEKGTQHEKGTRNELTTRNEKRTQDERSSMDEKASQVPAQHPHPTAAVSSPINPPPFPPSNTSHALLLLTDTALPLGSFAYSSGLESFLSHHGYRSFSISGGWPPSRRLALLTVFLKLSIDSVAHAALPFVLAAWREPMRLRELDDVFDAVTLCVVARRASVGQGRGVVGVWERCFGVRVEKEGDGERGGDGEGQDGEKEGGEGRGAKERQDGEARGERATGEDTKEEDGVRKAQRALSDFAQALNRPPPSTQQPKSHSSAPSQSSSQSTTTLQPTSKTTPLLQPNSPSPTTPHPNSQSTTPLPPTTPPESIHGHYPPLFGALSRALSLSLHETGYIFLLNHAKAIVGAAVRLGVCGPYKNWEILASRDLQKMLEEGLRHGLDVGDVEEAGQTAVTLDLWQGRHEVLYSRIFNS